MLLLVLLLLPMLLLLLPAPLHNLFKSALLVASCEQLPAQVQASTQAAPRGAAKA